MKAITVKQPYAHLICAGIKDIENRTWKTNYKGRILIHASMDKSLNLTVLTKEQYQDAANRLNPIPTISSDKWDRGAIIGSVEIVDCVINHPSIWAEKEVLEDWTSKNIPGKYSKPVYNWVLANPILFDKPILNVKGKLSFWDYDLPEEYETILKL